MLFVLTIINICKHSNNSKRSNSIVGNKLSFWKIFMVWNKLSFERLHDWKYAVLLEVFIVGNKLSFWKASWLQISCLWKASWLEISCPFGRLHGWKYAVLLEGSWLEISCPFRRLHGWKYAVLLEGFVVRNLLSFWKASWFKTSYSYN